MNPQPPSLLSWLTWTTLPILQTSNIGCNHWMVRNCSTPGNINFFIHHCNIASNSTLLLASHYFTLIFLSFIGCSFQCNLVQSTSSCYSWISPLVSFLSRLLSWFTCVRPLFSKLFLSTWDGTQGLPATLIYLLSTLLSHVLITWTPCSKSVNSAYLLGVCFSCPFLRWPYFCTQQYV